MCRLKGLRTSKSAIGGFRGRTGRDTYSDALTLTITDVNPFMTSCWATHSMNFFGKALGKSASFSDWRPARPAFRELQSNGYIRYEKLASFNDRRKRREVSFVSNVYENTTIKLFNATSATSLNAAAGEERNQLLASALAARQEADTANGIKG